jgi:hypothetical protein
MPRPRTISTTPSNTEVVETASTYTFKVDLINISEKVGEIISCERVGARIVVKTKVKVEAPQQPVENFVISFE